jgi:rhodanese-related sulfurtransferase
MLTSACVLGLILIGVLTVGTLLLAKQLGQLVDVATVVGAGLLGGVLFLGLHPELAWIADEPDESDATCGGGEGLAEAPALERISVTEAMQLVSEGGAVFIDARSEDDYCRAHIPGAMSLPAYEAEGLLEMQSLPIPPDGKVITYCEGGRCEQSEYLGSVLSEKGVCRQVRVLDGGWEAWTAAEGPAVVGDSLYGDPQENAG